MKVGDVVTSVDPRDAELGELVILELGVDHRTGTCARVQPIADHEAGTLEGIRFRFERYLRPRAAESASFLDERSAP